MSLQKQKYALTPSQKMMVFILSMSLYGLSNMFTELIPSLQLGPIELSVEYFAFIPLTLCILFHPFYGAVGASLGEVIFGELMLGQFGGLGELEKFILFSIAMYIAGSMVTNPRNRLQVGTAAMLGVAIHQLLSCMVDIGKVWLGIEELEAVSGLAESILVIEGVSFITDVLFSGTLFALLPTLYLVPRLYGKIEPLLGMKPRDASIKYSLGEIVTPRLLVVCIVLACIGTLAEFAAESDMNIGEWESEFLGQYGDQLIWVSIGLAAVVVLFTIMMMKRRASKSVSGNGQENVHG
ncbi:cell division protein FtsQ [Marinicrinis lubricantis]|uniref:Cell division protein FtsQ n=1 Tax=Marinicrinis lubricantis TaxID=2086470 RepID=A0ABW1IPD3_9BACL